MAHPCEQLAQIHLQCSNATSQSEAIKKRLVGFYLSKVVSEVLPSPIIQKPTNVEHPSKRKPSAGSWNFCGHFLSLKMLTAIMIRVMIANMKSPRPGGPSFKGHVRLGCGVGIILSSAKTEDIFHRNTKNGY